MSIADRIRAMITDYSAEEIATSLRIPLDLIEGILSGTVDERSLQDFDPSSKVTLVDKHIITRGNVLGILENPKLAAEIALYLSKSQATAVIDLEKYPTLPIHLGIEVKDIPRITNYLWDNDLTKTEYKNNLYLYGIPPNTEINLSPLFKSYPSVIINCSIEQMPNIYPLVDVFYIPIEQNDAGVYRLYQIFLHYKQYESHTHIVWICKNNSEKYLTRLRSFTNAHVAGCLYDTNYSKYIEKILEPILPAKKKRRWFS